MTWVKSFRATKPDLGCASAPLDVHLYVLGKEQVAALDVVVNVVAGAEVVVFEVDVPELGVVELPLPLHGRH